MLASGVSLLLAGFIVLLSVALSWFERNFEPAQRVLPAVLGTLLMTLGAQNIFGGFILSIVSGHEARFLEPGAAAESGDASAGGLLQGEGLSTRQ